MAFNKQEEFINDENLDGNPSFNVPPNFPITFPGKDARTFLLNQTGTPNGAINPPDEFKSFLDTSRKDVYTGDKPRIPLQSLQADRVEGAGFFKSAAHAAYESSIELLAFGNASNFLFKNALTDYVPEDFNPKDPIYLEEFDPKYHSYIGMAQSPNDLRARQQEVRDQMHNDEMYANGSMLGMLIGGGISTLASPINKLLFLSAGIKYAGVSQNVLMNVAKVAPGIALESAGRNMLIQAERIGGNLQDAATNSYADFIFQTALAGIAAGGASAVQASKLWQMRKVANLTADGINVDFKLRPNGTIIENEFEFSRDGVPLNAAETKAANQFINDNMFEGGIFKVPYVGEGIKKFLGSGPLASPVFKAQNSPYASVKNMFGRIAFTGVLSKGAAEGEVTPFSAYEIHQAYVGKGRAMNNFVRQKYFEANGLEGGVNVKNVAKNIKQRITKDEQISEQDFGRELTTAMNVEGYKSKWVQVNEAADALHQFYQEFDEDLRLASGKEHGFLPSRVAARYMPRVQNLDQMYSRRGEWIKVVEDAYKEQDLMIQELNAPIERLKQKIENTTDKAQKKKLNMQLFREENLRVQKIIDNEDYHILLEDRLMFTEQERNQLDSLLQPIRDASRQSLMVEQRIKRIKTEKKKFPNDKKIQSELNSKLDSLEKELKETKNKYEEVQEELKRRAEEGEINSKFFTRKENEIEFHNPNVQPKIRKAFESDYHRNQAAQQLYDAYLNMSPEDLMSSVFGAREPGIHEGASSLKSLKVLIDSEKFNEAGFLDWNAGKTAAAYASSVGRLIGLKRAFPEFADKIDFEGFIRAFNKEHQEFYDKANSIKDEKQRLKALKKVAKERKDGEKFMRDTYRTYMGTYVTASKEVQVATQSLKNLVASAKLGAVPIYALGELGAMVMKAGMMPFLAKGLKPLIQTIGTFKKTGIEGEAMREYAANAYLASHTQRGAYAQNMLNRDSMNGVASGRGAMKAGIWSENLAHWSGNMFGINSIANLNERLMASQWQSEVMQAAHAVKEGRLTKDAKVKMAHYGIDIEKEANRFIEQQKLAGGFGSRYEGYHSFYYKWEDAEASNLMSMSIRRAVQDTVINSNIFTSPYWAQNPFPSMIFMFHGWAYGALTHYTVPMMQRPTAENMLGMGIMVGLSLLSEPLLRLANGKEAIDSDEQWFEAAYKALDYSGIMGPYGSYFQDLNLAMGGALAPGLIPERMKTRSKAGSAGPVLGYIGDFLNVAGHVTKGDLTQTDLKRFYRLWPFSSHLAVRGPANTWIENSGVPVKRGDANNWDWYRAVHGE